MKCSLCGYEFNKDQMEKTKCSACPEFMGCELLCCPNCGYRFVEESKIVNILRRLACWLGK
jgi:predicted Zn-ribbon and HTH transcriptional regulator